MTKKLRVAAYARVSTDKDDQANSLDNQRTYFSKYITQHEGWQLVNVFYDEGISGTQTKKRKGFMEMIAEAESGEIDLIITKEVSRFARNTVDTLSYTRELKKFGVGVIFTLDNIDTRQSDGEFRLTIMASIAQEESRKTSERVKWGQRRQMEKGVVFGRDLLGYTVKDGKLYINEEEAEIVRTIFHKYTNEGKGTHVIARELQEEGMRPKRIALWSNVVILRALKNEKYVGDLMQKKTITPDYLTHKKKYNRGEENMVCIKEHHEPIISRDLWERTQEELLRRSPSEKQKSKYSNRYWCSGKLFCAECGRRYISRIRKRKDGSASKTWRCIAAAQYGRKKQDADGEEIGCDNTSVNEESLKTCMNYCISLIQSERESLKKEILEEINYIRKKQDQTLDVKKLEKQIDQIALKKTKAIDLMLGGIISKEDLQSQTEWYNEKLEHLNKELADAKCREKLDNSQTDIMEQYIKALDDIMDIHGDNELIYKEVLERIDLHKGNILDIWLKEIPVGIRLNIKTSGKKASYKTEILETTFIEK